MLASGNPKIKISRLHSMCITTQAQWSFVETECVNITALNVSEEETADVCYSNSRSPSLPNNVCT